MATTGLQFQRNDTDKSKINFGAMLQCKYSELKVMEMTTAAATAALPQFASVVQEGNSADELGTAYTCSGTFIESNDTIGIQMHDAPQGEASVSHCYAARRILVPLAASQTPVVGGNLYVTTATMLCTTTGGAGTKYIGEVLATKVTNPDNLPAGDWVAIDFKQEQI